MGGTLDLEKQLCFYSSYHQHPVNVGIHMLCIPMILFSFILLLTNSPTIIPLPQWATITNLDLNLGTIMALYYSIFYILLEPVAGTIITPILLAGTAYSKHLTTVAAYPANQIAFGVFCLSWIAQFIGHGAFEGRAPALFENLHMALVTAPFFEWIELLFKLGYRPELEARMRKSVAEETARVKAAKATGKNGKAQ
ncbi:hypothetical protein V491_02569 [Pseudogymnoascus sp. VKM F-3775]|nr:hypothetical protein V491_02569 [Pseudogymnoascus sp. VKM F-3775]